MGTSIGTRRYYYIKPAAMFRHNGVARPIFPPYPMTWETGRRAGDTWLCLDLTPDVYEENMISVGHHRIHNLETSDAIVDSPKAFRFCFCYFGSVFSLTIAILICSSAETTTCRDKFLGSFIEQFWLLFYFIYYQFTVDVFIFYNSHFALRSLKLHK